MIDLGPRRIFGSTAPKVWFIRHTVRNQCYAPFVELSWTHRPALNYIEGKNN
jgi:hypothetical protein